MKHGLKKRTLVLLWFSVFSTVTYCQIVGGLNETTKTGLGGNNYVVGIVFDPSGRPLNNRLRIKLISPASGEIITSTDDRGQFVFSGVSAGEYSIVIDGEKEFENVRQYVEVNRTRNTSPEIYSLSVRLTGRASPDAKPAIIRSTDSTASKKAIKLLAEARETAGKGDVAGAIAKLRSAVVDSPDFFSALNELGAQYMNAGDLASAEEHLLKAIKIDTSAAEPKINLGIVFFRTKRFQESEALLSKALEIVSGSAVSYFYLGRVHIALQRPDDAIKELSKAVEMDSVKFREALRLLSTLYLDKGEHAMVVQCLEAYLKLAPDAKDAEELRLIIKQNKTPRSK